MGLKGRIVLHLVKKKWGPSQTHLSFLPETKGFLPFEKMNATSQSWCRCILWVTQFELRRTKEGQVYIQRPDPTALLLIRWHRNTRNRVANPPPTVHVCKHTHTHTFVHTHASTRVRNKEGSRTDMEEELSHSSLFIPRNVNKNM